MRTYNRRSKWYITCTSEEMTVSVRKKKKHADKTMEKLQQLCQKDLHLRSYLTFEMAWRSSLLCQDEWWPACREHDIILMLHQKRLECMEVRLTYDIYDRWSTYLLDLLGVPQLHRWAAQLERRTPINHDHLHLSVFITLCSKLHFICITSTSIKTHLTVRDSRWKRAMFKVIK